MADQREAGVPKGYRFVPADSPEGRQIAASLPQSELTDRDRIVLDEIRKANDKIHDAVTPILEAEGPLSRIDEGPVTGRVGNLLASFGIGANVADYESVNRASSKETVAALRGLGGSDTEKEYARLLRQTVAVDKTPEFNNRVISSTKLTLELSEAELSLAERWLNEFGSFTAKNPKTNMGFEQTRRLLRQKARNKIRALNNFNKGGWSIEEVPGE